MGIDLAIVILLLLLGVALILVEIFFLPGITISGIAGALSVVGGISYAFLYLGTMGGMISIGSSAALFGGCFLFLVKSNAMKKIGLNTDIHATVDQSGLKQLNDGDKGHAISRLNPIGKAEFNGVIVEAKSFTGEYIEEDTPVVIVKVETYNVLVKEVQNETITNN